MLVASPDTVVTPASSPMVMVFVLKLKLGASFTAFTVRVKVLVLVRLPSSAIKVITGKYNDPAYLTAIPAKDSRNDAWTHHWALHDLYSRIDFIMVTRGLRTEVDFHAAKIIDDVGWDKASDHRAVMAVFK